MKKSKRSSDQRLGKLSLYPLTLEQSLKAFFETDPKKVRETLERKGIVDEKKSAVKAKGKKK